MALSLSIPGGKRDLIKKAGSRIFITISVASIIAAFCIVAINFMWDLAGYNSRVQGEKEIARDTLLANISKSEDLQKSFVALQESDDLIKGQDKQSNSSVILDALPRKYDFPALVTSIDKVADLSGVNVAGLSGNDEEVNAIARSPNPTPQEIHLSVNIEGTYKNINKFVKNLENTIRPIKVINIRLAGSDSKMSATFDLVTYYQPAIDLTIQSKDIE